MLVFVGQIQNVNTENVEPLTTLLEEGSLRLREDETNPNTQEEILSHSKVTNRSHFVVPTGKGDEYQE